MIPQIPLPFPAAHFSFDMYWPGANAPLVEQARRVSRGEEARSLLLWGGPGTGKSHLLQAACLEAGRHGLRAGYLPLAQKETLAPEMLEGLEALDLVCIDDLDAACGSAAWEQALFHLFNRLRDARRPLIMSASCAPAALPVQLPDLKSRLGWDLVFHLEPLSEETRFNALRHRAGLRGMEIPDEVLSYLSRRIPRDPHTLFAWLERLDEASLAAKKKLTVPFVKELIKGSE